MDTFFVISSFLLSGRLTCSRFRNNLNADEFRELFLKTVYCLHLNVLRLWNLEDVEHLKRPSLVGGRLLNTTSYWSIFVSNSLPAVIDTYSVHLKGLLKGIFGRSRRLEDTHTMRRCVLFNDRPSLSRADCPLKKPIINFRPSESRVYLFFRRTVGQLAKWLMRVADHRGVVWWTARYYTVYVTVCFTHSLSHSITRCDTQMPGSQGGLPGLVVFISGGRLGWSPLYTNQTPSRLDHVASRNDVNIHSMVCKLLIW